MSQPTEEFLRKILMFASIVMGSSLAGIAMLLWDEQDIPRKRWMGAVVLSGLAGLIVALILTDLFNGKYVYATGAISLLAGVGGASSIDLLIGLGYKMLKAKTGIDVNKNKNTKH